MNFVVDLETLAIFIILLLAVRRMLVYRWSPADAFDHPPGLSRAMLIIIREQDLSIDNPVPLTGRPDEVYRDQAGCLIPVETKKRACPRVYNSDRIQLSAYAVLLRHATHQSLPGGQGRAVANYGFVRLVNRDDTHWERVTLLCEGEVVRLADRLYTLDQGKVAPRPTKHPPNCRRCPYRQHCPKKLV